MRKAFRRPPVVDCRISGTLLFCFLFSLLGCREEVPQQPQSSTIEVVVNTQYLEAFEPLIQSAQRSISVVHFELNQDPDGDAIVQGLIDAASRGVAVSVLLEDSVAENESRIAALVAGGVHARLDTSARYTHAKLVVVDGVRTLFGSTNFSQQSMRRNNETNLHIEDEKIAGWFAAYAQALMNDPDLTPMLTSFTSPLGTPLKDGDYFDRASALIDGAKQRIDLVVYGMNADSKYPKSDVNELIRKLTAAKDRGVRVRVLLEISSPDLGVNDVNRTAAQALKDAGLEVRFDRPNEITHAKVLLVDDQAIVGSNNWGYGGFRTYHEVGLKTQVPAVITRLSDYVEDLWNSGNPAP